MQALSSKYAGERILLRERICFVFAPAVCLVMSIPSYLCFRVKKEVVRERLFNYSSTSS